MIKSYIDAKGVHIPTYLEILNSLKEDYKAIFGQDIYLEDDSQDGQQLAIKAQMLYDCYLLAAETYHSFSPSTATGAGLSNIVSINGLTRKTAAPALVDVLIKGKPGSSIINGIVQDTINDLNWTLPTNILMPASGEVTVTAQQMSKPKLISKSGTITKIVNPQLNWYSCTNVLDSLPGSQRETDVELRIRQKQSTSMPSESVLEGLLAQVKTIEYVTKATIYQNKTNVTDMRGLPPHSIALVVQGGDSLAIAQAILKSKTPGANTYGNTAILTEVPYMLGVMINFERPTTQTVFVKIFYKPLSTIDPKLLDEITASVNNYILAMNPGASIYASDIYLLVDTILPNFNTPLKLINIDVGGTEATATAQVLGCDWNKLPQLINVIYEISNE